MNLISEGQSAETVLDDFHDGGDAVAPDRLASNVRRRVLEQKRTRRRGGDMVASEQSVEVISSRFFNANASVASPKDAEAQRRPQSRRQRERSWLSGWLEGGRDDDEGRDEGEGKGRGEGGAEEGERTADETDAAPSLVNNPAMTKSSSGNSKANIRNSNNSNPKNNNKDARGPSPENSACSVKTEIFKRQPIAAKAETAEHFAGEASSHTAAGSEEDAAASAETASAGAALTAGGAATRKSFGEEKDEDDAKEGLLRPYPLEKEKDRPPPSNATSAAATVSGASKAAASMAAAISATKSSYVGVARRSDDDEKDNAGSSSARADAADASISGDNDPPPVAADGVEPYRSSPLMFSPFRRLARSRPSSRASSSGSDGAVRLPPVGSANKSAGRSDKSPATSTGGLNRSALSLKSAGRTPRSSPMSATSQLTEDTGLQSSSQFLNKFLGGRMHSGGRGDNGGGPDNYVQGGVQSGGHGDSTGGKKEGNGVKTEGVTEEEEEPSASVTRTSVVAAGTTADTVSFKDEHGAAASVLAVSSLGPPHRAMSRDGEETKDGCSAASTAPSSAAASSRASGVTAIAAAVLSRLTRTRLEALVEERARPEEEQERSRREEVDDEARRSGDAASCSRESSSSGRSDDRGKDRGRAESAKEGDGGGKKESGMLAFLAALFVFLLIGLAIARSSGGGDAGVVSSSSAALDDVGVRSPSPVPFPEVDGAAKDKEGVSNADEDPCFSVDDGDGNNKGDEGRYLRDRGGSHASVFFVRRPVALNIEGRDRNAKKRRALKGGRDGLPSSKCDGGSHFSEDDGGRSEDGAPSTGTGGPPIDAAVDETDDGILDRLDLSMKSHMDRSRGEGIRR